jgi:hypothetical protein
MENISLRRPVKAAYFVLICMAFVFLSCEKKEDSLGLGLQPDEEFLGLVVIDGLDIVTNTVLADSARTNQLTRALLGEIDHPVFGRYSSVIYSQIRLSALGAEFGEEGTVMVDSLILALDYIDDEDLYGAQDPMLFSVKRLAVDLDLDSTYYSNYSTEVLEEELLENQGPFIFDKDFEPVVGSDTLPPQLRLKLKNEIGDELVANSFGDESIFDDITEFLEFFKGLKIEASNQGPTGALATFDLLSTRSKMTLYYHNSTDTADFDFTINQNAQRYLSFNHDYTGTPIEAQLNDPSLGLSELHVQATGGVNFAVDISELIPLTDTISAALNKVELVIPVADMLENETFPFPERLFAVYENDEGNVVSVPDLFEGEAHSQGFYDEDKGEYRINITRFSQQLVNGVLTANEIKVLPTSNAISPNFVRLLGSEGDEQRVKLVVTYTEFE